MSRVIFIIVLCCLASVLVWNWESDFAIEHLAFSEEKLLEGGVWTLITSLFIHGDLLHLFGNMSFLYVFGSTLEHELGSSKTLTAFLLGGVTTFLLGIPFYDSSTYLIGASAAIFTLASIVMLVKPLKFSFFFLMPQGLVAIIYFVYNMVAIYYGRSGNIAYTSHVIGFSVGMPLGMIWSKEWQRNLLISAIMFLTYIMAVITLYTLMPSLEILNTKAG